MVFRLLTLTQGIQPEICGSVQYNPMGTYSYKKKAQWSDDREVSGESNHETDFNHSCWLWRKRTGNKHQGMKADSRG